jgi:hypothetical protein
VDQPLQPIIVSDDDVVRFHKNAIVAFLQEWASSRGMDMKTLAMMPFDQADREQFAQLIGYSLCGFGELSYVRDETFERAADAAKLAEAGRERTANRQG